MPTMNKNRVQELTNLREQMDAAVQTAERAAGALEELTRRLKSEFNCASIEEAHNVLAKLRREVDEETQRFDTALERFRADFADVLKGEEDHGD